MIHIILPFENATEYYHLWAHSEESIDFRKNQEEAKRCTLSFAAEELENHLNLLGLEAKVADHAGDMTIYLDSALGDGQTFSIEQKGNALHITGDGRVGGLYGVYTLLEAQGIRWYSPREKAFIPTDVKELIIPECKKYVFSMHLNRGFEFEGPLKDSELLFLWMGRNCLNFSAYRYNTAKLQRKLGMKFGISGHFLHQMLDPHRRMPSGNTLLEDHPDWFGVSGKKLDYDNALSVQFCMSNVGALEFVADELIKRINTDWYELDEISLYGIDTWGGLCKCEGCQKLGNGTDHVLHLLSHVRTRLDRAIEEGVIDHNVIIKTCAYEGTTTLEAPINGIPENLKTSGDYVIYTPILRCYEHPIYDTSCSHNKIYKEVLEQWKDIPMMVGEYWYVSRHADLPLIFPTMMQKDIKYYSTVGITGMSHLHLPMVEWGTRTMNQTVFAAVCKDVDTDVEAVMDKYFSDLYGFLAPKAKKAYALIEKASEQCASWRQWCGKSVISNLMCWDGKPADKPIYRDDHLGEDAYEKGWASVKKFEEAREILRACKKEADLQYAEKGDFKCGIPLNPTDVTMKQEPNHLGNRLAEDIRGLNYGIDTFAMMADLVKYHDLLVEGDRADDLWNSIEARADRMMEYTFGVFFEDPNPEMICHDVLSSALLKDVYYRCLAGRAFL